MRSVAVLLALFSLHAAAPAQSGVADELLAELGVETVEELVDAFPLQPTDASDRKLKRLADLLQVAGALADAEALQEERLRGRIERFGEDDPRVEPVLSDLGWLALASGRFAEAVGDYEALLERARESHGEDSLQVAVTRINLASAHQGTGEYANVERDYLEALGVVRALEGPDGPTVRVVLHNLSVFLMEVGELSGAELHAREAHRIRLASDPEPEAVYEDLQLLGLVHTEQARLELAELELRETLALARRGTSGSDARVAESARYLGDVLRGRGELEGAARAYEEALAIYTALHGERHFNTVRLLHAVSLVAQERGELARAHELMARSVELSAELFDRGHPAHVQRLLNLASLEVERGEPERAEALCRGVLERDPLGEPLGPLRAADARAHLGEALLALGRPEAAAAELGRAGELRAAALGSDHPDRIDVALLLADALEAAGELDAAAEAAREGLALAERQRGRALGDELERARHAEVLFHRSLAERLARLELARGRPAAALDALELGRGRLLLELMQRNERALFAGAPERRAELERAIAAEDRARFHLREVERRRELAQTDAPAERELERAREALRSASAGVFAVLRGAWPEASPLGAEQLLARLAPDELVLSYTFTERAAFLIVLAGGERSLSAFMLAEGAGAVERLAARTAALARALAEGPDRRGELAQTEIEALASALLPEGARELALAAPRVVVVSGGPLAGIPFELLLAPGEEREDVPELVHAPSATVYMSQRALGRRSAVAGADKREPHLVALAAPHFEREGKPETAEEQGPVPFTSARAASLFGRTLEPLPATRVEAERAAGLFGERGFGVTLLVAEGATRGALERAAGRASVLHLATHGVHGSEERPFDAALAVTPVRGEDDAFLTLDRLVRTWSGRLSGCELVVLSACDTHREVRAGAGTLSLAWGFFHSGAPSVLATRWRVDDRAAALFVSRFYENLLGRDGSPPVGKAASLREAQSWLRSATRDEVRAAWKALANGLDAPEAAPGAPRGGPPAAELRPYADPFYWAAFVLLGAP